MDKPCMCGTIPLEVWLSPNAVIWMMAPDGTDDLVDIGWQLVHELGRRVEDVQE